MNSDSESLQAKGEGGRKEMQNEIESIKWLFFVIAIIIDSLISTEDN